MTSQIRQRFQTEFGNAGLGFVFPYSLIHTNGERYVRFSSNINWDSQKNTSRENTGAIGIAGYSLLTDNKNFVIELNIKNKDYLFNTLRILTPNNHLIWLRARQVFPLSLHLPPREFPIRCSPTRYRKEKPYMPYPKNIKPLRVKYKKQITLGAIPYVWELS